VSFTLSYSLSFTYAPSRVGIACIVAVNVCISLVHPVRPGAGEKHQRSRQQSWASRCWPRYPVLNIGASPTHSLALDQCYLLLLDKSFAYGIPSISTSCANMYITLLHSHHHPNGLITISTPAPRLYHLPGLSYRATTKLCTLCTYYHCIIYSPSTRYIDHFPYHFR
jgi:hypothetical protein